MPAVPLLLVLLLTLGVAAQVLAGFDSRPSIWQLACLATATTAAGYAGWLQASGIKKTRRWSLYAVQPTSFRRPHLTQLAYDRSPGRTRTREEATVAQPVSAEERARLRQLHAKGLGRNAIAAELGRSAGTVTKLAAEMGLSFDRAPTVAATAAAKADAAALRAALNLDYLADAQRLRQQVWQPHEYVDHGGRQAPAHAGQHAGVRPVDEAGAARRGQGR